MFLGRIEMILVCLFINLLFSYISSDGLFGLGGKTENLVVLSINVIEVV